MQKPLKIAAMILAGGQSSRMNGQNKALCRINHQTLLEISLENLSAQINPVWISANDPMMIQSLSNLVFLTDHIQGFKGPLAGIHAGLKHCIQNGFNGLISVAVDTPFFGNKYVEILKQAAFEKPEGQIYAIKYQGMLQPVFALWKTEILEILTDYLDKNENLSIKSFFKLCTTRFVEYPSCNQSKVFFNVNFPQDLQKISLLCK